MQQACQRFESHHQDFIHDIAYDYYGKRMATCSSDKKIKIWDKNETGEWVGKTIPKAHSASINRLTWAHPEFGPILASCSSDKTVLIWEEQTDNSQAAGTSPKAPQRVWKNPGKLVNSRAPVMCVAFSPRHHGLRLASCSQDGKVRIYESNDVMNLKSWPLVEEFQAAKENCTCISWNPSPFDPPMIVVGSGDQVQIWEFEQKFQRWEAVAELPGHKNLVNDVAWAMDMGRMHHLIATACKDERVRIFKLTRSKETGKFKVDLVQDFDQHHSSVWRVSWNVTGTMLASTGDDGAMRVWRKDYGGEYKQVLVAHDDTDAS